MLKLTYGQLNEEGSKAVYLTDKAQNKRMFCFWYNPSNDNPLNLAPKQAITLMIEKAGYHDWKDFWNTNEKKQESL